MRVIIEEDYDALSRKAAAIIARETTARPTAVPGFATGSTPIGVYGDLIKVH
jgi:glucosamine-6-phosphate deaminase